jgi:CMP-N-acetylneuraminic acid synthetase
MYNEGEVTPINQDLGRARRGRQWTQEKRRVFREDGAIYVLDAHVFAHERISRFSPMVLYERDQSRAVDIDTIEDWKKAEIYAKEFSRFP